MIVETPKEAGEVVRGSSFDRKLIPGLAGSIMLMLAAGFLLWDIAWGENHSSAAHTVIETGVVLLLLGAITWLWVQRTRTQAESQQLRQQIDISTAQIHEINRRLDAVFRINRISVDANDEREMVELALQLAVELTGAKGASFVPLDDRCQPLAMINYGDQPSTKLGALIEYLASPEIHERCSTCSRQDTFETCPLLEQFSGQELRIFCFPLKRGEHNFGMLNLYVPKDGIWPAGARSFVQAMANEIALSLDGVRLRQRELIALRQLQRVRAKADLDSLLSQMLDNVRSALEADFATLTLLEDGSETMARRWVSGEIPEMGIPVVVSFLNGVIQSGEAIRVGEISNAAESALQKCSMVAVPLISQSNQPLGGILVGNCRVIQFHPRQMTLLQTVAGQVALVIHNAHLMAELEYQTTLDERTRLAREIHDGLAQTLGFLKLQMVQMQKALEQQDTELLKRGLALSYQTVSGAYEDAREAIDDLFIDPSGNSFIGWIEQIATEFAEDTSILVTTVGVDTNINPRPEVQIQLIRIIQEALSNIRKHANASQATIACGQQGNEMILEISDNGCGFAPSDTPGTSHHGLRGMRERAELIDADFQLTSRPDEGATVHIRWAVAPAQIAI